VGNDTPAAIAREKVGAGGTAKWTSNGSNDEWRETTAPFVRPCIVEKLVFYSFNVQGQGRCAALSRSVRWRKGTGSTAGLGIGFEICDLNWLQGIPVLNIDSLSVSWQIRDRSKSSPR
jgi:hypothetical protein